MAIIQDNYSKYQIIALATNQGETFYSVKEVGTDELEMFNLKELKLLCNLNLPLFDNDMKPIRFEGNTILGNIPDVSDMLYAEEIEDTDGEVDDFFSAYDEEEEVSDEYSDDSLDDYDYPDEEEADDYDEFASEDETEDFFAAYADDEEEYAEESTVSKLYSYLTNEQIKILKRYYLWYSQRLFTDAQKDPTFGMKDKNRLAKKKADLNNLRNTGGLWHYAGFIDMGYKGAGYCTLGHPLRYMHLAWDVTASDIETAFFGESYDIDFEDVVNSDDCIVFGIKCIGDFFEVDKECIDNLKKAQRESLKDMSLMHEYYAGDIFQDVFDTFTELDKIIKKVKVMDAKGLMMNKDYKPIVPANLTAFYLQFRENNMIPPKSLVQEIRDNLIGWKEHKFVRELRYPDNGIFRANLVKLFGKTYKDVIEKYNSRTFYWISSSTLTDGLLEVLLYVYFTYEICGYYKYNADTNKDEGGTSKQVKAQLGNVYNLCAIQHLEDSDFTLESIMKHFEIRAQLDMITNYKVTTFNISRFSSRVLNDYFSADIDSGIHNHELWDLKEYSPMDSVIITLAEKFDSELGIYLNTLSALDFRFDYRMYRRVTDCNELLKTDNSRLNFNTLHNYIVSQSIINKFNEFIKYIEDNTKSAQLVHQSYLDRKEQEKIERERQIEAERLAEEERKKELEDSVSSIDTPQKMVDYLKNADLSSITGKEWSFHLQVLDTIKKSGKEPSSRQAYYIQKLFEHVSGADYKGINGVVKEDLSDESLKAIEYVLNNKTDLDDRTIAIITTVSKTKKASEKQMKYVKMAEEVYKNVK